MATRPAWRPIAHHRRGGLGRLAERRRRRHRQRQLRPGHERRVPRRRAATSTRSAGRTAGWSSPRPATSRTFGHWDVVSPGTGYNVLTVGGVNDRNTAGTGDDALWYAPVERRRLPRPVGAAWNPHGDFNKPNVSAPAVSVRTANGTIGKWHERRQPDRGRHRGAAARAAPTLATWPEATRALIMAGAIDARRFRAAVAVPTTRASARHRRAGRTGCSTTASGAAGPLGTLTRRGTVTPARSRS